MQKVIVIAEFNLMNSRRKLRVGELYKESANKFVFRYSDKWLKSKHSFPICETLPLAEDAFYSERLFAKFKERISNMGSDTFYDYCRRWKISHAEADMLTILATVGHRGPSCLVYYPSGFLPGAWQDADDGLKKSLIGGDYG